jgi:gluconate 2-dehydrogenase gamma chain
MPPKKQSRRAFLGASGSVIGGSWIALHLPAVLAAADFACTTRQEGAAFEILTAFEAAELEAIAAQIIPTDDTPGAREAGVIYFIDRALNTFRADDLEPIRAGLQDLESRVREDHAGVEAFSALTDDQQIEALRAIEESDFFRTVRFLTVAGMFAHPSYGGNRDKIGWQLLGFDDRHQWQPPFGYYDAQYTNGGQDGGQP